MQPGQWQSVPGAPSVEVYPYLRKPDVLSSNSYILRFPQELVVIDPGGRPDQTQSLVSVVRRIAGTEPLPVEVLLTHCHVDHALEVLRNDLWRTFSRLRVTIQENGARALTTGDRRVTQAEILGCDLPGIGPDITLFKSSRKEPAAAGIAPGKTEWINLGGAESLEVYYTPGHSPDGVCYRVGEMLFVGDLLAAVSPLIAGAPGWDHEALVQSLSSVLQLVETRRISACALGHGNLLMGDEIAAAFRRTLAEASLLARIETVDARRVRFVSESAQELCEELSALFGKVHITIDRVAGALRHLEEFSAADKVRQILQSDQVSELLAEFRNFREGLLTGEHLDVQVALKGVQVVHRISRLMEYDKLARIIEPALLNVARFSLADFLQAAKGLRVEESQTEIDLNALVARLTSELSRPPGASSLEEVPEDPAGFSEYLVGSIALAATRKILNWKAAPSRQPATALLPSPRFNDTLKCLLMDLAEAGAKEITLSADSAIPGNSLAIRAEFGQPMFGFIESQISPYRRRFRRMRVNLATQHSRTGLVLTLPFMDNSNPR